MGEVDQPQHTEHQGVPDGDQRIDRAPRKTVDRQLPEAVSETFSNTRRRTAAAAPRGGEATSASLLCVCDLLPSRGRTGPETPSQHHGPGAVPQPGAVLARLQRAGARARRGPAGAAARAGQVLRHLQPEPRRVLPGPGGRPEGPGRRRHQHAQPRRPHPVRAAAAEVRSGSPSSPTRWSSMFLEELVPALAEVGIRFSSWDELDEDDREYMVDEFERADLPGADPARRRSRPSVPLHLDPLAEPGRRAPRPGHRPSGGSPG